MAWRIDKQLIRGELDNRTKGTTTGTLWFAGLDEPVTLHLTGNPWRDLAGHRIRFTHASPEPGDLSGLAQTQQGVVGDITASRKVRMPDCPMDEFIAGYKSGKTFTFHMANCLYLEWFSEFNGRVVIESVDYVLELDGDAAWVMTEAEEAEQIKANSEAIMQFMERIAEGLDHRADLLDEEADQPTSATEAEADAEDARSNRLLDRITARLEREGHEDPDAFERIWREEREKLRIEMGEPAPEPLTPEQEAERAAWIEEMNEAAREALEDPDMMEELDRKHPLAEQCFELGIRLFHEIKDHQWVEANAPQEHPLHEIEAGVQIAGAKLAGALNGIAREREWPPDPMFAGDTLVRLKKARRHLKDALAGLDAADEQRLADSAWRSQTRRDIEHILSAVQQAIDDVRASLE
ncbi:MAG TPA: hypothetical protein PKE26_11525 [Kiritimatiellia bacterium]|nr:hypothetical protein [Kiritimatiellia bacterium]HMO99731.1 hypothetical protein [Kiritimatiellia bacterium]HMP97065.1 hypothetical protein [Kiritimatiellia bacterium]